MAAGTTVIEATGVAGITLRFPTATTLPKENITVETDGEFAYVGLAHPDCHAKHEVEWDRTCMWWGVYYVEEAREHFEEGGFPFFGPTVLAPDPGNVDQGLLDVYIVADGSVTIRLAFGGLEGERTLSASGEIDGLMRRLDPVMCPETLGDCEHFGHAGISRTVGPRAFAAAIAYSLIPWKLGGTGQSNRGSFSAAACLYPDSLSRPGASADPGDHPQGCDILPPESDESGAFFFNTAVTSPAGVGGVAMIDLDYAADEQQYAGFVAEHASAGGGFYGGWGIWVSTGITCDEDCQEATTDPSP